MPNKIHKDLPIFRLILKDYRLFVVIFILMLILLLIRIPLGTFNQGSSLDVIAHFVLPAVGAPLLFVVFRSLDLIFASKAIQIFLAIVLLGVAAEVVWEIFEFGVDSLTGLSWQISNSDTMIDIISAVVGSSAGAFIFNRRYAHRAN